MNILGHLKQLVPQNQQYLAIARTFPNKLHRVSLWHNPLLRQNNGRRKFIHFVSVQIRTKRKQNLTAIDKKRRQ